MATVAVGTPPTGIAALSRVAVARAADLVQSIERAVVGESKIRTAQGNAYAALCADRARAQARAEMDALVRALIAEPRAGLAPITRSQAAEPHVVSTRRAVHAAHR